MISDDLVLAQLDRLAGVLDERGHVAGQVVLARAPPDHQRRVAAGADDHAGRVGVDREQRERALEPPADPAHRLGERALRPVPRGGRRPPRAGASSPASRWAAHSVSVSLANSTPSASSSARSRAKFSMIPLWITATRPLVDRCGWALRSVGPPWVAQRVWPMPVVPLLMSAMTSSAPSVEGLLEIGQLAGALAGQQLAARRPSRPRPSRSPGTPAAAGRRPRCRAPVGRRRTPRFRTWLAASGPSLISCCAVVPLSRTDDLRDFRLDYARLG